MHIMSRAMDVPVAMAVGMKETWSSSSSFSEIAGGHGIYARLVGTFVIMVSMAVIYLKR